MGLVLFSSACNVTALYFSMVGIVGGACNVTSSYCTMFLIYILNSGTVGMLPVLPIAGGSPLVGLN